MLFDGPSGEKASAEDGCSLGCSLGLGEEELHFLQKFLDVIRANPEKAESLYGKFQIIVEEEEKDKDQDVSGANLMRVRQPSSMRRKREAKKRMKMGKKNKQVSKQKKVEKTKDRHVNSKKRKIVKSKAKKINKKRKKRITNKNNNKLERKKKKTLKLISRMKKNKQKRKKTQGNVQKSKFLEKSEGLENCTNLWAEFSNVGFRLASTLKKQVMMDIEFKVIKVNYLAGKFHNKQ